MTGAQADVRFVPEADILVGLLLPKDAFSISRMTSHKRIV
jgi:hypothetical protein